MSRKSNSSQSCEVTATLMNRHPAVALGRIAMHLRLEKLLAAHRKDHARSRECHDALRCIHELRIEMLAEAGAKPLYDWP
jgi:hypothetical protein